MDFELVVQRVYESVLESGDIAIDVGAHIGRHTFPMARKVIPNGKVFAFEPLPICQNRLLDALQTNSQDLRRIVSLYPIALGDDEGTSEFVIVMDDLGYSGLRERKLDHRSRVEKIKVSVRKLDNVLHDIGALKYIKIDAEGGEYNILKGAANTILKFRPTVTFEFGASSYSAYCVIPEEVFAFWHKLEYKVYDVTGNLLETEASFAQSSINQYVWDYIALPNEDLFTTNKILQAIKS